MKLDHLLWEYSQRVDEKLSTMQKLAALGWASMAGMVGTTAYNAAQRPAVQGELLDISAPQAPTVQSPLRVQPHAQSDLPLPPPPAPPRSTQPARPAGVHANFPAQLHTVADMSANHRVAAFVTVMQPMVEQENRRILALRDRAISIAHSQTRTGADQAWLAQQQQRYGARDIDDLITRMDAVPVSLVLAQSAVETGWGSDHITRAGNAFFGQRAWSDLNSIRGPQGERYRAYDHPHLSVRSYMHNLNTHAAYEDFRKLRSRMRAQGQPLRGVTLAQGLLKYSTRGTAYVQQLQSLIRHRLRDLEPG